MASDTAELGCTAFIIALGLGLVAVIVTTSNGCAARDHKEWRERYASEKAAMEPNGWYCVGDDHWVKEVDGGHLHKQPDGDIIFIPTGWKAPE